MHTRCYYGCCYANIGQSERDLDELIAEHGLGTLEERCKKFDKFR